MAEMLRARRRWWRGAHVAMRIRIGAHRRNCWGVSVRIKTRGMGDGGDCCKLLTGPAILARRLVIAGILLLLWRGKALVRIVV